MGSKKRNTPFRSKWKPSINTLDIATARVAKLSQDTVAGLQASLDRSVQALSQPDESARAWLDLRLACIVSRRVERMGVVRGLSAVIEDGYEALESMRVRNMSSGVWSYSQPLPRELEAIKEMTRMHAFQLGQLSAGEFERVFLAARSDLASLPKISVPVPAEPAAA